MIPLSPTPYQFYETPFWATEALLRIWQPPSGVICDPCVGFGGTLNPVKTWVNDNPDYSFLTNDINPEMPAQFSLDACKAESWEKFGPIAATIANPPWGALAARIAKNAVDYSTGVALLTRVSFQEGTEDRGRWFQRKGKPNLIIHLPRYCFRKNKEGKWATDGLPLQWMIWDKRMGRSLDMLWVLKEDIPNFYRNPDEGLHLYAV